MPKRVLDTNVLLRAWHGQFQGIRRVMDKQTAKQAALALKKLYEDSVLVTPVKLEMLCGVRRRDELQWTRTFLAEFKVIDAGELLPQDWVAAERHASRTPHDGKPRDFADCLIRALADRLHAELITFDKGVPPASSTKRKQAN